MPSPASAVDAAPRKPGPRPGSGRTRDRILDEAERIIATKGPDGLSLQEVADAVGIRPPSIFSHFRGIPALSEAVYRRVLEGLAAAVARGRDENDAEASVVGLCTAYVRFVGSNPAHVRLILQQLAAATPNSAALQHFEGGQALVDEMTAQLGQTLEAGRAAGQFRQVAPEDFMAFITGASLVRLAWHEFQDWEAADWPQQLEAIRAEICDLALRYVGR